MNDFLTAHEWFMHDQAMWWAEFKQQEEARRYGMEQAARRWAANPEQLELPLDYAECLDESVPF
jgi:hypothetical protein